MINAGLTAFTVGDINDKCSRGVVTRVNCILLAVDGDRIRFRVESPWYIFTCEFFGNKNYCCNYNYASDLCCTGHSIFCADLKKLLNLLIIN